MSFPIGNPPPVHTGPVTGHGAPQGAQVNVQQAAPAPRSLLTRIGEAIQQAFGLGNPGAPRSPEARAQAQMAQASQGVVSAFNKTSAKPGDGEGAAAAVMELTKAAQAISTASQGAISADQAFGQAVDAALGTLPLDTLANMARAFNAQGFGSALQGHLAKDPAAERYSMLLEQKVKHALTGQVMQQTQGRVGQAVSDALALVKQDGPQSQARAALTLVSVLGNADGGLGEWASSVGSGLSHPEQQALVTNMAQQALGALAPEDRDAVLNAAPSEVLARLATSHADKGVHAAVSRTIEERTNLLNAQAQSLAEPLLARQLGDKALVLDGSNAAAFVKDLDALAASVHALRAHTKATGQAFPEAVDAALAKLLGPLEDRIQSPKANLSALTDAQFSTLREGLKALGVPDSAKAIANDAARRLAPGLAQVQTQLGASFTALLTGQPAQMLSSAQALNNTMNQAIEQRKTVLNDLQGAPEIMRLREGQVQQALANLPEAQLFDLFAQLQSPRFAALQEGLYAAVDAANQGGRDDIGRDITQMAVILDELKGQVIDQMEARGVKLPRDPDTGRLIMPSADERFTAANLEQGLRDALRAQFGVAIDVAGRAILQSGVVRGGALAVMAPLVEFAPTKPPEQKPLSTGVVISNQMYMDAFRSMGVAVEGMPGLDRSNWDTLDDSTKEARIAALGTQLLGVVGNDPAKLMTLTDLMHQGMAAGFEVLLHSPDNPIKLPNGESVVPRKAANGGRDQLSMQVRRDPTSGDVYVRLNFDQNPTGSMVRADGSTIQTNPTTSYFSYSYEAKVNFANGKLEMSGPVGFRYNLAADPDWQKPYPRPSSLASPTPQDVGALLANSDGVAELGAFMKSRYNEESLAVVTAIDAFIAAPTLQKAEALRDQFLLGNSPQYINTSNALLGPVLNAIDGVRQTRNQTLDAALGVIEQDLAAETDVALYQPLLNNNGVTGLPGWPQGFAVPASYGALLASGNAAAINAFHAYADHPTRTPENGAFRNALADFRNAPTEAKAQAMFATFIQSATQRHAGPNAMPLNLSNTQVQSFAAVLNAPTAMLSTTFDTVRTDQMPLVTAEVQAFWLKAQDEAKEAVKGLV